MADEIYKKIVWKLNKMTKEKIEAYKFGEKLESESTKIVIGDNVTEWFLRVYFGGKSEEDKDSIGLYLVLKEADSRSFKTKYTLGIVGMKGSKEGGSEKPGESFNNGGWGFTDFLKRADFLTPDLEFLVDGKLMLYCKLIITAEEVSESSKIDSLNQNQLDKFKRMMDDEHFADFEIETTEKNNEKKVLKVHKHVLAFGSPYFYGMLTTAMKETKENFVRVPEDSVIMKAVLQFIYTGDEVENLSEIANELVFAAEKYQLGELKQMCLANISKRVSNENVLHALLAADSLTDSEKLKGKCIRMTARNFKSLCKTKEWKKLSPGLFTEILHQVSFDCENAAYV